MAMERIENVPSGQYFVSKIDNVIAQAFLGSCVGLVIFDKENEVGGLYHILLPEPSASYEEDFAEKYAKTGLPLFFTELEQLGAKKENMKAVVVGGALMGDVTNLDLQLDIGGRTSDVVLKYLEENNIETIRTETGGYFGYKLSFNFNTFEFQIEMIGSDQAEFHKPTSIVPLESIDKVIQRIKPIPQIALKVIRMIHADDVSMRVIGKEIRQDQVLTAKIIQLSNSAFVNPRSRIQTIDQALVMLGERRILLLTLSIFTEWYYKEADNGYSLCKGGLFQHALATALAAQEIAKITRRIEPELGYTAGLLHDIGKIVLDQWVDRQYPLFYRHLYSDENLTLSQVEQKMFNIDHTQAGAKLAKSWELPENLALVIEHHHNLEKFNENPDLLHIINFANLLVSYFKTGLVVNKFDERNLAASVEYLKMTPDQIIQVVERVPFNNLNTFGS